ncbi:MAG: sigma-70 family RNA polymerase sigma factor [Polyangiaceae bacterium]|nr:sigma-70 family RNA polymerase sigma factor [Polyangiaceae bacterium]
MSVPSEPARAESALIEAALAGDGAAFRRLVAPHLGMLFRLAARVSDFHADDAVQETLTLAFERLDRYRAGTSLRAYLAGIAVKQAHTLARTERRRLARELASARPEGAGTPEEHLAAATLARRVRAALAAMPKKRREAAMLRLDAGLSHQEIARALDTTEGSARVLVHLAVKELREALADLVTPEDRP